MGVICFIQSIQHHPVIPATKTKLMDHRLALHPTTIHADNGWMEVSRGCLCSPSPFYAVYFNCDSNLQPSFLTTQPLASVYLSQQSEQEHCHFEDYIFRLVGAEIPAAQHEQNQGAYDSLLSNHPNTYSGEYPGLGLPRTHSSI